MHGHSRYSNDTRGIFGGSRVLRILRILRDACISPVQLFFAEIVYQILLLQTKLATLKIKTVDWKVHLQSPGRHKASFESFHAFTGHSDNPILCYSRGAVEITVTDWNDHSFWDLITVFLASFLLFVFCVQHRKQFPSPMVGSTPAAPPSIPAWQRTVHPTERSSTSPLIDSEPTSATELSNTNGSSSGKATSLQYSSLNGMIWRYGDYFYIFVTPSHIQFFYAAETSCTLWYVQESS